MAAQEIIYVALENLQKSAQIEGKWEPVAKKELDGKLVLKIDNQKLTYNVEIKNELRNQHLKQIIELNQLFAPLMVVAPRLIPKMKEELRYNNIAYLEANGNIFLKNKETTLWIDTNKPLEMKKRMGGRAFTKTGLKVVFQFLLNEEWINKPYRELAKQTGTGIGNISNIITGLKQDGFLLPVAKNQYKLNNKKELLNKWIAAYDEKLKPTLKVGTFRFLKEEDFNKWKTLSLLAGKTWWGGEPAADLYTNFLRPSVLTLYTTEARKDLIKNYKLIPDEKGNVKAFDKFWQNDEVNNKVPPLLVYADLINANDRRCTETAQKMYDEFLQNKL
jgi:hypothetical protein